MALVSDTGIVIIGRNEAQRLQESLQSCPEPKIYVDSGSTDDSRDIATNLGVQVIELSPPFSASRGRNAGWVELCNRHSELEWVQFVDGDTELEFDWIAQTQNARANTRCGAIFGRLTEKTDNNLFGKLLNHEWKRLRGPSGTFGGNVMVRVSVLQEINGFDESLHTGEERDLYRRIVEKSCEVQYLDVAMARHNGQHDFHEWWRRNVRLYRHTRISPPGALALIAWNVLILGLILMVPWPRLWFGILLVLVIRWLIVAKKEQNAMNLASLPLLPSLFIILGKFPNLVGLALELNSRRRQ